jgi:hypothetical protein
VRAKSREESQISEKSTKRQEEKERITWHTAFYDAIRLELYECRDVLAFELERPLTSEPLRIDAVVIKKKPGDVIKKNIASIFKGHNIVSSRVPKIRLGFGIFTK